MEKPSSYFEIIPTPFQWYWIDLSNRFHLFEPKVNQSIEAERRESVYQFEIRKVGEFDLVELKYTVSNQQYRLVRTKVCYIYFEDGGLEQEAVYTLVDDSTVLDFESQQDMPTLNQLQCVLESENELLPIVEYHRQHTIFGANNGFYLRLVYQVPPSESLWRCGAFKNPTLPSALGDILEFNYFRFLQEGKPHYQVKLRVGGKLFVFDLKTMFCFSASSVGARKHKLERNCSDGADISTILTTLGRLHHSVNDDDDNQVGYPDNDPDALPPPTFRGKVEYWNEEHPDFLRQSNELKDRLGTLNRKPSHEDSGGIVERDEFMILLARQILWRTGCRIYGGFVRDWLVGGRSATDIDIYLDNGHTAEALDKMLSEVVIGAEFWTLDPIEDKKNCTSLVYSMRGDEDKVNVDLVNPNVKGPAPFVDCDINNLMLKLEPKSRKVVLTLKEPRLGQHLPLAQCVQHIIDKQFVYLYDWNNSNTRRMEKFLNQGYSLLSPISPQRSHRYNPNQIKTQEKYSRRWWEEFR